MDTPPIDKKPDNAKKPSTITLVVIALTLVVAGGLRIQQALALKKVVMVDLAAHGQVFHVEMANTDPKRELGLGKRDSLPADHGMYFQFPAAQYWVFWMKGMRFPIDIVWIQDGKVVDISADVPVDTSLPLKTYSPVDPADAVLELNAGTAARIGLVRGDMLAIGVPGSHPAPPAPPAPPTESATAAPVAAPSAPAQKMAAFPDESSDPGTFSNRALAISFDYPPEWGAVTAREDYLPGIDTGKSAFVTFASKSDVRLRLFTADYSQGVGEGWPGRFIVTGSGPIRNLADAQARIYKDIVAFSTTKNGMRFAFNAMYGGTELLTVVMAPHALNGAYVDAQATVDPDATMVGATSSDPAAFTPAQADRLLAAPAAKAERDAVQRMIESLKPAAK